MRLTDQLLIIMARTEEPAPKFQLFAYVCDLGPDQTKCGCTLGSVVNKAVSQLYSAKIHANANSRSRVYCTQRASVSLAISVCIMLHWHTQHIT
jgi:hypothetical protein